MSNLSGKYTGVSLGRAKGIRPCLVALKKDFDVHVISTAENELAKEIMRVLKCTTNLPLRVCPKVDDASGEYAKEVATRDLRGQDVYIVDSYPVCGSARR